MYVNKIVLPIWGIESTSAQASKKVTPVYGFSNRPHTNFSSS